MARLGGRGNCWLATSLVGGWMAVVGQTLQAAPPALEHREFTVLVDGRRAGEYHMTIRHSEDGTEVMTGQANVRVSYLAGLKVYRYSYRGTETWKAGKLQRFESSANDDGKDLTVWAVAESDGLRAQANGKDRFFRSDVWLTTFWHSPDPKFRNRAVPLMDADTGEELAAKLTYVGITPINIGGQVQNCAAYRVTGDTPWELWYDGQERLVRLKSISNGYKYELVLTSNRR
jgi:Family of unknown function (DUF6134)